MNGKTPRTATEARERAFSVDTHCYPWVAYKGPRGNPNEWHAIRTDLEEKLLAALKIAGEYVRATHGTLPNPDNIISPDLKKIDAAIYAATFRDA